ncbi:MAG TPA: hypothetical protein VKP88_01525, partial [Candidatus Paceibacterota bacterium]|nr:hypothetical protein [Candidatus Paceibacterota bacterium]
MSRFPRYNVWLDWGDGATAMHNFGGRDLVRQSGFSKDVTLHKDLKPVQDKASFTLDFTTSLANTLLTLDYDQIVTVDIDRVETDGSSTHWFYGYVRPITTYDINSDDKTIEIEALDNSWRLERPATNDYFETDIRLDDAIDDLLSEAGYSSSERAQVPSLSQNVRRLSWESNDEALVDILEEMLFAFGYVFYFDETGAFRVYNWASPSISASGVFNDNNIIGELTVDRDDDRIGVKFNPNAPTSFIKVKEYDLKTENLELYVSDNDVRGSNSTGTKIPSDIRHDYSPDLDAIENAVGTDKYDVVGVDNLRIVSEWVGFITRSLPTGSTQLPYFKELTHTGVDSVATTFSPVSRSILNLQFTQPATIDGDSIAGLYRYIIRGDVEIEYESGFTETPAPAGLEDEIDNFFVTTGTGQSTQLVTAILRRAERSIYRYAGTSDSFFGIGQYVTVQSSDLNIDTVARVVNRSESYGDGYDLYEYEFEGAAELGTLVGSVTNITGNRAATNAATVSGNEIIASGLNVDGTVRRAISGNSINDTVEFDGTVYDIIVPTETGLFFNSTSLGFYDFDTSFWPVRIYNDEGTGKLFAGNSTKNIEWDGSELTVNGAATISGEIKSGDGIQSTNFVSGSDGWRIDGDGTAEFDAATIRGTIEAT